MRNQHTFLSRCTRLHLLPCSAQRFHAGTPDLLDRIQVGLIKCYKDRYQHDSDGCPFTDALHKLLQLLLARSVLRLRSSFASSHLRSLGIVGRGFHH